MEQLELWGCRSAPGSCGVTGCAQVPVGCRDGDNSQSVTAGTPAHPESHWNQDTAGIGIFLMDLQVGGSKKCKMPGNSVE